MSDKTVKVNVSIVNLEVKVPCHWDRSMIEFYFNDSCWCADNLIDILQEKIKSVSESDGCLCPSTEIRLSQVEGATE